MIYMPVIAALIAILFAIANGYTDTPDMIAFVAGLALTFIWYRMGPLDTWFGEEWTFPLGAVAILWGMWRLGVYGWLFGITSSRRPGDAGDRSLGSAAQQTQPLRSNVIATPQTAHNESIVFDPAILRLAELSGDDPRDIDRAVLVLGRLLVARKKSGDPLIGTTDAIRYGLRISPGSKSPRYAAAKEAIERELARLTAQDGPQFADGAGGTVPGTYPVSREGTQN